MRNSLQLESLDHAGRAPMRKWAVFERQTAPWTMSLPHRDREQCTDLLQLNLMILCLAQAIRLK